ncbi:MAG: butyrate kinase, partial [Rikenellaceae bacterium]|nr:butyrate kinase [Rikenellaceae bacterium]
MSFKILAINPGSTSTKAAVFEGREPVARFTVRHTTDELGRFDDIAGQLEYRRRLILDEVGTVVPDLKFDAVIGRGGLVKPIPSGVYEVDERMLDDLRCSRYGSHASNLGAMIAAGIAEMSGARAFLADPVVVDEMEEVARITGLAGIGRKSIFHALNQKAVAREYAAGKGVPYESLDLIVAHLGGGISV